MPFGSRVIVIEFGYFRFIRFIVMRELFLIISTVLFSTAILAQYDDIIELRNASFEGIPHKGVPSDNNIAGSRDGTIVANSNLGTSPRRTCILSAHGK